MQDLEKNMDELFRKAAADYPLKINESGWDEIAAALPQGHQAVSAKKNNSRKYIAGFFLLLGLLLAGSFFTYTNKGNKKKTVAENFTHNKNSSININQSNTEVAGDDKKLIAVEGSTEKRILLSSLTDQPLRTVPITAFKNKSLLAGNNVKSPVYDNTEAAGFSYIDKETNFFMPQPVKLPALINEDNFVIREQLKVEKKIITGIKLIPVPGAKRETGISQKNNFYLGAMIGPLSDEVKNQGLKKTGFSAGIIGGYKFKKNWSVETGLFFAKKPYYSAGKYFSMKKISSSMQGMDLLSLEGNNQVLEIPLKLKYDFLHGNKSNLFSSAGFTSYVCTYEKNNYLVFMNGAQQTMISSYKNKSRSLAATLELSAGYEYKTGKSTAIRIEPYMQVPLKGMGIGSMYLKSSGVRLGITRFFN